MLYISNRGKAGKGLGARDLLEFRLQPVGDSLKAELQLFEHEQWRPKHLL